MEDRQPQVEEERSLDVTYMDRSGACVSPGHSLWGQYLEGLAVAVATWDEVHAGLPSDVTDCAMDVGTEVGNVVEAHWPEQIRQVAATTSVIRMGLSVGPVDKDSHHTRGEALVDTGNGSRRPVVRQEQGAVHGRLAPKVSGCLEASRVVPVVEAGYH